MTTSRFFTQLGLWELCSKFLSLFYSEFLIFSTFMLFFLLFFSLYSFNPCSHAVIHTMIIDLVNLVLSLHIRILTLIMTTQMSWIVTQVISGVQPYRPIYTCQINMKYTYSYISARFDPCFGSLIASNIRSMHIAIYGQPK